jgi:hypothetical protein
LAFQPVAGCSARLACAFSDENDRNKGPERDLRGSAEARRAACLFTRLGCFATNQLCAAQRPVPRIFRPIARRHQQVIEHVVASNRQQAVDVVHIRAAITLLVMAGVSVQN